MSRSVSGVCVGRVVTTLPVVARRVGLPVSALTSANLKVAREASSHSEMCLGLEKNTFFFFLNFSFGMGKYTCFSSAALTSHRNESSRKCQKHLLQCPKLSFYFVHLQGALPIKLCTLKLLHAPSQYRARINDSKNVHTSSAHLLNSCTRPWKCGRRVQGAPLISDTVQLNLQHCISSPTLFPDQHGTSV